MHERRMRKYDQNIARSVGRMADRVREPVPFCWFCTAASGQRSKEHIFPRWLLKHLGAEKEMVEPVRISLPAGGIVASKRGARPLQAHVNGEVCASCNNGWMNDLEVAVRPLLSQLPQRGQMTRAEAEVLARWFIKVAVNLNVSQPYRLLIPEADRHELSTSIPPRFAVDLFRARRQDGCFDWIQGASVGFLLPSTLSVERLRSVCERTLSTNIRVTDLVARVIYLPAPLLAEKLVPATDATTIWPLPSKMPFWSKIPRHDDYMQGRIIDYNAPLMWT